VTLPARPATFCGLLFALAISAAPERGRAESADRATASDSPAGSSPEERSHALFEAGQALYERGQYHEAADAFRRAYELLPVPALLYNLAQAERLEGRCDLALSDYRHFADAYAGAKRADLDEKISRMQHCVDEKALNAPEAETTGRSEGLREPAPPATRRATVTAHGAPKEPRPMPAWVGWTAAGVGVTSLLAGAVMGAMVLERQSVVEAACPNKRCRDRSGLDAASEGRALLIGTIAASAVGVAGLGLGLYVWTRGDSRASVSRSGSSSVAPAACVVTWGTTF
jgi:tetratricopeptide (TPR) repeat protein